MLADANMPANRQPERFMRGADDRAVDERQAQGARSLQDNTAIATQTK